MTDLILKLRALLGRINQRLRELDGQVQDSVVGDLHGLIAEAEGVVNVLSTNAALASGRVNPQSTVKSAVASPAHQRSGSQTGRNLGRFPDPTEPQPGLTVHPVSGPVKTWREAREKLGQG